MLKNGFYWVLIDIDDEDVWIPAEHLGGKWQIIGLEQSFTSKNFLSIGSRINPPISYKGDLNEV